ncbi:anti-phage dCTP deaminase [Sorangium sp. So ce887]|uniref:anti-phage dCTP deaminase n=1 Tax=Sorangium sp. So ce887 TaxID=3133324 RepID=UPI003F5ED856
MRSTEQSGNELVIGLVGAIGTDLKAVSQSLERAFETVDYQTRDIHLIEQVMSLHPRWKHDPALMLEASCSRRMDIGNELRAALEWPDALALLAMTAIQKERERTHGELERPIKRCAYVLRSLKTPEEVKSLRQVYGSNCFVVAVYASKRTREAALAERIAHSHYESDRSRYNGAANRLIERDEREHGERFGQNVRDTFGLADVFVNAGKGVDAMSRDIRRFVELLFGHPFSTPTREECGMFQAHGAGLRSASAGRQVGAAIATLEGDIVSVGTNEVAKAFGGQYWAEDEHDQRDHKRELDSNAEMTRNILADLFARLRYRGWLKQELAEQSLDGLLSRAEQDLLKAMPSNVVEDEGIPSLAESARVKHVIEFIRAVHAEMAALMSAARRGVAVDECVLYSTTFPCHECAKHIVVAGVRKVVFIEPYPKSKVADLYGDSIAVDGGGDSKRVSFQPFVGVAPRRYVELFTAPERKKNGSWVNWEMVRREQEPRLGGPIQSYVERETELVSMLEDAKQKLSNIIEVIYGQSA